MSILSTPLRSRLLDLFGRGDWSSLPDEEFNSFALDVFVYQVESNPILGRFAESRGRRPHAVGHWTEIPMVPTAAFKRLPLLSGDPDQAEAVFRTSGTTGQADRGTHYISDLALYHGALLPNFRRHLVPDGESIPILSLIPDVADVPDSSLSHMIQVVRGTFGDGSGASFSGPEGQIRNEAFLESLRSAEQGGIPVLLVGTAFSFVHWLEVAKERGIRVKLSPGSRIMETGGFKGRSREVPRARLYAELETALGVPASQIVNEYGMTEMCSQFYETVLIDADPAWRGSVDQRCHVPPPWVRSRVLHPVSLAPQPMGSPGLLCHMDLANLGSVSHLLTEDMGVQTPRGFRLLGRAPGAEPRGCSLTMEALMRSQRGSVGLGEGCG